MAEIAGKDNKQASKARLLHEFQGGWAEQRSLARSLNPNLESMHSELVAGLTTDQLQSLATIQLNSVAQHHLDDLCDRATKNQLSLEELRECDRLLLQAKMLNVLQRSARHVLAST
jgi:hypothetical protein